MRLCTSVYAAAFCLLSLACADKNTGGSGNKSLASQGADADGGSGVTNGNFGNSEGGVPSGQTGIADAGTDDAGNGSFGGTEPISIDQCTSNTAGLSAADVAKLRAGSGSAGSLRMLYPYDGTVFPRGMISPSLMWDGGGEAVYVHIKSMAFEYEGCLKPSATGLIQLPQNVWDAATSRTYGAGDPYSVELSVLSGGSAMGPVKFQLKIAQATLKGSIFYNSYSSKLAASTGLSSGQGAVLRISAGKMAEVFLNTTGCNACHSVSASGNRMISLPLGASLFGPANSSSYAITPDVASNPAPLSAALPNAAFPGISPDGTLYLTSGHQGTVGPRPGSPVTTGGPSAGLFETDTASEVSGAGIPTGAMTPMFAPSAKAIAFTDFAIDSGHGLAVMDFDVTARKASNYRKVFATGDAQYPAWPFFLPDDKGLVFAIGAAADFSGAGAGLQLAGGTGATAPASDLHMLELATGKATLLAQAMGFATVADAVSGKTYLPFGAKELHHHYYPTVAPVAAGGYFWVFFDSLRHYGNRGLQRQIWGAAVDISPSGDYSIDRSHPAFYLPGQEPNTGNHRAFTALDPCRGDDDDCTTGIDCCGGHCYVQQADDEFGTELKGTCKKPVVPTCSKRNERCATNDDCCAGSAALDPDICIAGFCAQLPPE